MFLLPGPSGIPAQQTRVLRARELLRVPARDPVLVECRRGSLWVTAGAEDVVLEGGQSCVFASRYPLVLQALSDAELSVGPAATDRAPRSGRRSSSS